MKKIDIQIYNMKELTGFKVKTKSQSNGLSISSEANTVECVITGDIGSHCHLHILDNSSPVKFYNFKTKAFSNGFISENNLDIVLSSTTFGFNINLPASSGGNTYIFLLIPNRHLNTQVKDNKLGLLRQDLQQEKDVTVRFSTSSDQADTNFVGIGAFIGSTSGSSNSSRAISVDISEDLGDTGDGLALGYKYSFDTAGFGGESTPRKAFLADSLQPVDSDFFTKLVKETNGTGSSSTSLVLNDVDNLVVGMSLVDIESSSVTTSGSLGVLTYPTITNVNRTSKTITLSSAHSWADAKDVTFRAYGSRLINRSVGLGVSFDLSVVPKGPLATTDFGGGIVTVNGDQSSNSINVDGIRGVSVGSKIFGPGVNFANGANTVTAVHASGSPITLADTQTLADNTLLVVYGSSINANIRGTMKISRFPSISTDVFYDIDRAFILATNS